VRHRKRQLAALRRESERDLREQIHRLLSQPMSQRTHFLRVRLPCGGSARPIPVDRSWSAG
jgi:hypothetical protein